MADRTGPVRLIAIIAVVLLGATAAGTATRAAALTPTSARAHRAQAAAPSACGPCTYVVTPTGTGAQSLPYVLAHLVHSGDVVELADGVYRVGELDLRAPNVTIRAVNLPAAGAAPQVWLDGSIPYQFWSHPTAGIWTHSYKKDFCAVTLRNVPCNQLSVSYHADEMFQSGAPIAQTLHPFDLLDTTHKWFYIGSGNHQVLTNFDPGTTTEMTNEETALVFESSAASSALEGIGVRRYAGNDHDNGALASHHDSAVYVADASNIVFRNDSFSFNAVRALKTHGDVPPSQTPVAGAGVLIDGSVFDHNGELGLDAIDSDGMHVQHSLFYKNNYENFQIEQGAAKFLSTYNVVVVENRFVENNGIGLWFDRSAYNALVAHNLFVANVWHGMMFEISAKTTITGNQFVGNGHIGMLIYEASEVSFSHNLLRGNLEGLRIYEGHRTLANFPQGRDSDPDRIMPSAITFDVAAIDIHANGFYYAPARSNGDVCDPNPSAMPTSAVPDPYSGCQYMIAAQDSLLGREPTTLGIKAVRDNFHTRGWPSNPTGIPVPLFAALWKAPAASFGLSGCVTGPKDAIRYRWGSLAEFQCAGQEAGAVTMF